MSLRRALLASAAAVVLASAACGTSGKESGGSATMRPGENCLASGCHGSFTAAGTVYASAGAAAGEGLSGATVIIDGAVRSAEVTTNAAGNFYTSVDFGFPATVTVRAPGGASVRTMSNVRAGGCAAAACHDGAFRVHVP